MLDAVFGLDWYRDCMDLAPCDMIISMLTIVDGVQATGFTPTFRHEGQHKANFKAEETGSKGTEI